jgi:hypothetical protein
MYFFIYKGVVELIDDKYYGILFAANMFFPYESYVYDYATLITKELK